MTYETEFYKLLENEYLDVNIIDTEKTYRRKNFGIKRLYRLLALDDLKIQVLNYKTIIKKHSIGGWCSLEAFECLKNLHVNNLSWIGNTAKLISCNTFEKSILLDDAAVVKKNTDELHLFNVYAANYARIDGGNINSSEFYDKTTVYSGTLVKVQMYNASLIKNSTVTNTILHDGSYIMSSEVLDCTLKDTASIINGKHENCIYSGNHVAKENSRNQTLHEESVILEIKTGK